MNKELLKIHEIYYNDETNIVTVKTPANGNFEISKPDFLVAQYEYKKRKKSTVSAYVLWFFLGILGAHRFYVGDYLRGGLLLITLGGFIIGWLAAPSPTPAPAPTASSQPAAAGQTAAAGATHTAAASAVTRRNPRVLKMESFMADPPNGMLNFVTFPL